MTDYRAILRLDSLKLQHKQIAESLGVSSVDSAAIGPSARSFKATVTEY